ncbi:hypothetical protein Trco_000139 [Trichoderma cornu-damae]|uniref:Transcription factor domain-containing protein n=1 Tax=Trichoderma cornu-damae TaxID=654480 RepID=A0A9P8U026_9HYPO|nr:hypothetical protein Trco_000139 [Trichoderma cornu-damae]
MFRDDSRQIASEYRDGLNRYANAEQIQLGNGNTKAQVPISSSDQGSSNPLLQGHTWHICISPEGPNTTRSIYSDGLILQATEWRKGSTVVSEPMSLSEVEDRSNVSETIEDDSATHPITASPATSEREFLDTPEHVRYLQIYVEEIAIWIDSLSEGKYFSQCLPYRALDSPLLLYSLLACGIRRLSDRHADMRHIAAAYYSTANMQLFRYHENPERDVEECSVAAIILKLYNIMFREGPQSGGHSSHVLNSIVDESKWNAESGGIGSACFWLNAYLNIVGSLEAGRCPYVDGWSVDASLSSSGSQGSEETWVQRMLCILAKVISYRLYVVSFTEMDFRENRTLENHLPDWKHLKQLCDEWNDACPRNMRPLGYTYPEQTGNNSTFPKAWLPKQEAIVCRLLYHTAQCILTQTHPMEQTMLSEEMSSLQLHHAREVCGIVAHTDHRCTGPMSIQALLIASSVLTDHEEQKEVLEILQRMKTHVEYSQRDAEAQLKATRGWDAAGPTALPLSYDRGNEQAARMVSASTQTSQASTAISPQQSASSANTPYTPISMPRTNNSPERLLPSFSNFGQTSHDGYRASRLLILDHLEIARAQTKRPEDAVAEAAQLAPHLRHFGLLSSLCSRRQGFELRSNGPLISRCQSRHPREGAVVFLRAGEVRPAAGLGTGPRAPQQSLCADAENVGLAILGRDLLWGRFRGAHRRRASCARANDLVFDLVVVTGLAVWIVRFAVLGSALWIAQTWPVLFLALELGQAVNGICGGLYRFLPLLSLYMAGSNVALYHGTLIVEVVGTRRNGGVVSGEGVLVVFGDVGERWSVQ